MWHGGVLSRNGKIYGITFNNIDSVLIIDTETNTADTTTITGLKGGVQYGGGVLAPNGVIYGIPLNKDSVLRIKTGLPKYPDWMLQSHFNKF